MKNKQLPDKLSDLLIVALTDLELCENDERYNIFMGAWHTPCGDGICHVCLAGSVIAKSYGISPEIHFNIFSTDDDDVTLKLTTIENARRGVLPLDLYSGGEMELLDSMSDDNRPQWKLHMQDIIGVLQSEGL